MQEKVIQNHAYHGVAWVDKPNVSDGLRACWVFNPTSPLCHFFVHSTIGSCLRRSDGMYAYDCTAKAAAYAADKVKAV